ncbi:MAG: hypothetical protein IKY97_08035 [Mailhella sp.]|nr:hypothetical protein [Mailhella sp.]
MFRRHHTEEQDTWLKELFQSRRAGTEFMLPWVIDTYVTTVTALKQTFSAAELKTVIDAHEGVSIDTSHLRVAHLLLQVMDRCDRDGIHERHGSEPRTLESKCRQLDDTKAAVLILWASSFWRGKNTSEQAMEKYISVK